MAEDSITKMKNYLNAFEPPIFAVQQSLEDPAAISLHDEMPHLQPQRDVPQGQQPQQNQQPLPYGVNRMLGSSPPPRQENHNNAPTHGYQVDNQGNFYHNNFNLQHNSPPQQAQLQNYPNGRDALPNNRNGQKQLQDQIALNDKDTKQPRGYHKKMTGKKEGKTSFLILVYFAIVNAHMPLPANKIYEFVKTYFPRCVTPGSESWKNSLRGSMGNKGLFVKLNKDQVANPIPAGKSGAGYYAIRKGPEALEIIDAEMKKFLELTPENNGLRNQVDLKSICDGTTGCAPLNEMQHGQHVQDEEEEDIVQPPVKRSRHEEEAQRAANDVEQQAGREEEYEQYQQRGYDNQMYQFPPIRQMAVSNMGFQFNNMAYGHFNLSGQIQFPYINANHYDPNVFDNALNIRYGNEENQDPVANQLNRL